MVEEINFDFKIRDELKKRIEYKVLRSDLLEAGGKVNTWSACV